ncbi:hypothetical protein Ancab_031391 [Ancistrocladus abbreviatus]
MMLKLRFNCVFFSCRFNLKSLIYYSTSTNTEKSHFMVDYLVKSLGFSEEEAMSTSIKVSHFKSTMQSDSVINFLKQVGFDNTQIKRIVFCFPKVLSSRVDKTLKPKIKVFQDHGLSGFEVVDLLSAIPSVFSAPVNIIKPSLQVLKTVFTSNKDLVDCIKRSQWVLTSNFSKYLQPNILLLRKYGLSTERIHEMVRRKPRNVLRRPKWLEDVLGRVEGELGIPRKSPMFIYGIMILASLNRKTLESKIQVFKSYGWTESDILTMVRRLPLSLGSSEAKIRCRLGFFMNELGYEPAYLANHPTLLLFSLEKRIVPRIAVFQALREKQLIDNNWQHYTILKISEAEFLKRFVLPFKDELPDICKDYVQRTGSSFNVSE